MNHEMINIKIPYPLRPLCGGRTHVEGTGETLGDLIMDLSLRYPGIDEMLIESGELKGYIHVFAGGGSGQLRSLSDSLNGISELIIMMAVAGG
ncbi:MAG: hypothetical protein AAGU27_18510 [Dehalobacterium sp.]